MTANITTLEVEIKRLTTLTQRRTSITERTVVSGGGSRSNTHSTYKVKTFELAQKLAVMDGTDDGMYQGLPIEVPLCSVPLSHPTVGRE